MADKDKLSLVILIVLIIVSLSLAGGVFFLFQKEKARNASLQSELEDLKNLEKITEAKLEESKKTIFDLGNKLQDSKSRIDALTGQLDQEKNAKTEALNQLGQLKSDLDQQKSLRADLEKKVSDAQTDAQRINTRLQELEAKNKELETKRQELEAKIKTLESISETQPIQEPKQVEQPKPVEQAQAPKPVATTTKNVELGTIVVSPEGVTSLSEAKVQSQPAGKISSSLEGKVLVVNKDYSFAIINLGNKDGVAVGNVFSVYHNNKYTGDIKIEKIHDSMSAGGFLSADMKNKVNEGDSVMLKSQ